MAIPSRQFGIPKTTRRWATNIRVRKVHPTPEGTTLMPTTPRKRVNKRIRYYLKTVGVPVTGSCGHDYVFRSDVPKELQKLQRTPERDAQLERHVAYRVKVCSQEKCPGCLAEQSLYDTRHRAKKLTKTYGFLPLPPMEGTPRMISFGERIRYTWWNNMVGRIFNQVNEMVRVPTIALSLLASGVNDRFTVERGTYSDDLVHLYYEVSGRRTTFKNDSQPGELNWGIVAALMKWLLIREETQKLERSSSEWPAKNPLWAETNAEMWIRASKGAHAGDLKKAFQRVPELDSLIAAFYTALRVDWETRQQMEESFHQLQGQLTADESTFLANSNQLPLPDALDQLTVYKGLVNPYPTDSWNLSEEDIFPANPQLKAPF